MLKPVLRKRTTLLQMEALASQPHELVVWWYGGIVRNNLAKSVPKVAVFFRTIDSHGYLGTHVRIDLALTNLGLLRIGTIWQAGKCTSEILFDASQATFDLDFTEGRWEFVSPSQKTALPGEPPIRHEDYPLRYANDRNWLLRFPLKDGKTLLVPCLEFYTRLYGFNTQIRRDLAILPWEECAKRFYAPPSEQATADLWPVSLTQKMRNKDAVFLSHLYHDDYARKAAKSIYAQIASQQQGSGSPVFLQVMPWFEGKAKMKVQGRWINDGKTFLALRILGSSEPGGPRILCNRPSPDYGVTLITFPLQANEKPDTRVISKPPMTAVLTDDEEPDLRSRIVDIEEPDFEILGKRRTVTRTKTMPSASSPVRSEPGPDASRVSTGDGYGKGKGVGHAQLHTRLTIEAHGTLRGMWDALVHLKNTEPDLISMVEWFTFKDGFSAMGPPRMISLNAFEDDDPINNTIKNWVYSDTQSKTLRGVLVMRAKTVHGHIYILEIERRIRHTADAHGQPKATEESFKGLVTAISDEVQFKQWLPGFLSQLRGVKGIVQKLLDDCPDRSSVFNHTSTEKDTLPLETTVRNAIRKVSAERLS